MNKVFIKKNTLGDTRTAEHMPSRKEFDDANKLHIRTETHGVCSDIISRADAIEAVRKELVCDGRHETHDKVCRFIADVLLPALPSAEAVHGEWGHMIADGEDGSHWYEYECSHCGEVVLRPYNYCPNCGARMFREDGEA